MEEIGRVHAATAVISASGLGLEPECCGRFGALEDRGGGFEGCVLVGGGGGCLDGFVEAGQSFELLHRPSDEVFVDARCDGIQLAGGRRLRSS